MESLPPLPGERLLKISTVAKDIFDPPVTIRWVYDLIESGQASVVFIDGVRFMAESEARRIATGRPSKAPGVSARWRKYREWKATQEKAA
jgi:hypothetical protein